LANAAKHSAGGAINVVLEESDGEVRLSIEDSGTGFDPEQARSKGGLGLTSMEERARYVGGSFSLTSKPGAGTRVEVLVPSRSENKSAGSGELA
jgi:signal transduction histidine kinase